MREAVFHDLSDSNDCCDPVQVAATWGAPELGGAMRLGAKIIELFRNPLVWIFFGLFLLVEYWNYQKTKVLDEVCELTGPHNVSALVPKTDREKLDSICLERELGSYENE
jgi:hypothetical protein